jgi:23S rRNA (adenine2503-C2)-methyltransferase
LEKIDIKSLSLDELKEVIGNLGEKPFRAKQLYEWMHVKLARSYDEMTNIPKSLKEKLENEAVYTSLKEVTVQTSKIDGTKKFLFELCDGNLVESVWMKYHHGNSVCISSQVGCRMGCRFCASTLDGLERNLTPSEMLDQIYAISRITNERVSNVVVMGTGEPLDNYDNLVKFIKLLTDENGLNISQRNVTVSTCGIVENMKRLADEGLVITLALSLHGSTQEKRRELMPIANKYDISEVIAACRYYFEKTGRRVTFEYSLVGGVNDTDEDADNLCTLVGDLISRGIQCHFNLIPVNPIKERDYVESEKKNILAFQNKLERKHINVTIRREMGRDIDGACGQLRRRKLEMK